MGKNLLQQLGRKEITKLDLFQLVAADLTLIPILLEGISSPKATVRYGCGSVLMDLTEKYPDKLYLYMDTFVALLESKHRILKWNALACIANLTTADAEGKFDALFDRYYAHLGDEYMVTVANTVAYSAKIAANKPYLGDKIAAELLKVQDLKVTPHLTEECKLVIAEHTIRTFRTLIEYTTKRQALVAFAQRYAESSRASLKKEAQGFLKKWQ